MGCPITAKTLTSWPNCESPTTQSSVPTRYSGQGRDHIRLAYSNNGTNFVRGLREPLIPSRQPGQPPFASIWALGMLVKDDEILIYSDAKNIEVSLVG